MLSFADAFHDATLPPRFAMLPCYYFSPCHAFAIFTPAAYDDITPLPHYAYYDAAG